MKKNESVQVNAMYQDKKGFMWFGTSKGLFKFNGKNYQRFTRADSLPDENITAITEDSSGRIWTGHYSGNLAFLEDGRFQTLKTKEGAATQPVSDIVFDKQGIMWFSTRNDGLYYYRKDRLFRLDEMEKMPDLFVYDLQLDSAGRIWAGTDGGVAICTLSSDGVSIDVLNYEDGLPDNIVKKILLDRDGSIWMATEDAGIIHYLPDSRKFEPLGIRWSYGSVNDFLISNNAIWVATSHPGFIHYDRRTKSIRRFAEGISGYGSFAVMFRDREGNIWSGSRAGVLRTVGDHLRFIESPAGEKLNVLAVAPDRDGGLWYATGDGLFHRTIKDGIPVVQRQLTRTPYARLNIISLYMDEEGQLWAGLYGEGALRIDPSTGKVERFSSELRNGNVLSITGKGNTVWFATLGGIEEIRFTSDGRFSFKNYNRQAGLSSDFVYQVFVDSKNRLWLATDGKGVDMIDQGKITHYSDGLPSQVVYGFAEDANHRLWANVQGNGIYRLEGNKFQPMDSIQLLRDNNVSCLAADMFGNLLVMHDIGIDLYNPQTGLVRYYDEETGIGNKKGTLNAISCDLHGNLYLGSDNGIIEYSPDPSLLSVQPQVAIERFNVFDQGVAFSETPKLKYNENSITIHFYGLWYQDPGGLQFRYKMDNYDEDWIATGDNQVTYSRLPAGDYNFRIRVSPTDDFSGAQEASVRFTIKPPFWETPVFYGLLIIALGSAAYSIVKYRERKLKEDKLILERKVEERTMEIQRNTEEIQAQNEEIMAQAEEIKGINENLEMIVHQRTAELEKKNKALEEYAFINAHKLRSPLASILGCIHLFSKTNLDDEAREINRHLQQRADELDDIVRQITKAIERGEK